MEFAIGTGYGAHELRRALHRREPRARYRRLEPLQQAHARGRGEFEREIIRDRYVRSAEARFCRRREAIYWAPIGNGGACKVAVRREVFPAMRSARPAR